MKCEGTVVHYWCKCSCGFKFKWASQPFSKRLAAASFYVGGSPTKLVRLLNQVGVVCFTTKTYDNIQSAYLVPAVRNDKYMETMPEPSASSESKQEGEASWWCSVRLPWFQREVWVLHLYGRQHRRDPVCQAGPGSFIKFNNQILYMMIFFVYVDMC